VWGEDGEELDIITDSFEDDDEEVEPVEGDETDEMVEQMLVFIFELVVEDEVDDDENFLVPMSSALRLVL
jgi:hypothetical protein